MRILITTMAAEGHFRPLVPIAHAALRAGHQVAVCAPATAAALIAEHGLAHLPAGEDWVAGQLGAIAADPVLPAGHADQVRHFLTTEGFPGAHALAMARDILGVTASWRPEVIVRENAEFGGYLAAEVLGLPQVTVQAGEASADYLDPHLLAPALDIQRAALGLPPDPAGDRIHAYCRVLFTPADYGPGDDPQVRRYRQANPDRLADALPEWVADLPTTVPLVLAAFGTMQTQLAAWRPVIDAVVAGLGMIECSAVVAVGAASDLVQRGPVPPNVRVCSHVPQPLLLECCDLFVHHGGFNSVREALRLAVPMVIIPWMNDSGVNAARCEAAGVARLLDRVGLSPVTVGEVCAEVLTDPAYRGAAKGMQRRILALPSVDILITDLESLVRASSPARPPTPFQ